MELDNRNQQVDRWLDAAIKQYGTVEPHPDLEQDVLRRLRSAQKPSKPRLEWLGFAAAMVALLAVSIVISNRHQDVRQVASEKVMAPAVDEKKVVEPRLPPAEFSDLRKRTPQLYATEAKAQSWPAQFPVPRPLTKQEKLLAKYVRERPQEAKLIVRAQEEMSRLDMLGFERPKPEQRSPHSER